MVSVCVTVLNEAKNASAWLAAMNAQTLQPDEIVVVDGGSTDGTQDILRDKVKLLERPKLNIRYCPSPVAAGRNIAVLFSTGSIIAITDMGCIPSQRWLETLVCAIASGADVAYGESRALGHTRLGRKIDKIMGRSTESHRSLAFKVKVWDETEGFPEVSLCAEDTLWNEMVRRHKFNIVHTNAAVMWLSPKDARTFIRQMYRYAKGDGIARLRARYYALLFLKHLAAPIYWPFLVKKYGSAFDLKLATDAVRMVGYVYGRLNYRAQANDTRMPGT